MRSAGVNTARKWASNSLALPPAPHMQKRSPSPSRCTSPSVPLSSSGVNTWRKWSPIVSSPLCLNPQEHRESAMSLPFISLPQLSCLLALVTLVTLVCSAPPPARLLSILASPLPPPLHPHPPPPPPTPTPF